MDLDLQVMFTEQNGIKHIVTSPYHPSSNGMAERAVQMFKQGISKLQGAIENRIMQFLFKYRVTPQTTTGLSHAELLVGKRLQTHLDLYFILSHLIKLLLIKKDRETLCRYQGNLMFMISYMLRVIMVLKSGYQ